MATETEIEAVGRHLATEFNYEDVFDIPEGSELVTSYDVDYWRELARSVLGRLDRVRAEDTRDIEGEEVCRRCGGPNRPWAAPSPLWNAVMRGGSINGSDECGGIICPTCFVVLAEERGIACGWWVEADTVTAELETVTPSGRVWDPHARRWAEAGGET